MCNKICLNLKHWMCEMLRPSEVEEFSINLEKLKSMCRSAEIPQRNRAEFQEFIWSDEFCSLEVIDALGFRSGGTDFPWGMINSAEDKAKLYASIEFCIQLVRVLKRVDVNDSDVVADIVTNELNPDVVFGMFYLVSGSYWFYILLSQYFGIEVEGRLNINEFKKQGHTDFNLTLKYRGKSIAMRTDTRNLPM